MRHFSLSVMASFFVWGCGLETAETNTSEGPLEERIQCEMFGRGAFASDGECDCDDEHPRGHAFGRRCRGDSFGGRVSGNDFGASGHWVHRTPDAVVHLDADSIFCRIDGAVLGDFEGTATINGDPGFVFRVHVQDHGAPNDVPFQPDFYRLQVFDVETELRVLLREGDVAFGDLTVFEPRLP